MTESSIPAGIWRRVGAKFCDWTLVFALQVLLIFLLAGLDVLVAQPAEIVMLAFACLFVAQIAYLFVAQIAYFALGNSYGRRTFGYRLAGLRLENLEGQPLSPGRSWWRSLLSNLASTFFVYGGFLDYLCAALNREKRSGHDFVCKTRVVSVAKPRYGPLLALPTVSAVLLILWTADIISPSALRAFYIPAGSMEPTLQINDRLLSNLLIYHLRSPQNGEIAIFEAPKAALMNSNVSGDVDFIKRVVGVPGDAVWIANRQLYRNGMKIEEPYAQWDNPQNPSNSEMPMYSYDLKIVGEAVYSREYIGPEEPGLWAKNGVIVPQTQQEIINRAQPGKVPKNCYLTLGDNRSNSNDSHVRGFAPRQSFQARAMVIFWPFERWKMIQK